MSILWSAASRSEATSDDSSLANLRTGESPRMNSILDDIFATTLSSRRTKPLEQTSRRLSTLHELVIKLACSNLSDVSIDDTLYPAIGAQLGTGATFSVESREAKGRKLVAVKHIEKTLLATSGYSCTGPTRKRLEAVLLEVYALLHLGSLQHRNIVELLGFGWDEGPLPYLVLEFADLGTLDGFLAKNELSSSQKEQIMLYLASGLELIHACGIIHGDVKLENILVFSDPPNGFNVKYADFGFCCSDTLGRREYHGTSVFNAPEIRRQVGRPAAETEHDFKEADVYSYGLAAWEIANDGRRYYSVDAIGISLEESHAERALSFLSELDSKNQELFKFAVMFLQDLELPPSISAPLSTVMEMSLQRDPLSRAEIRDIRLVLDPENE
jgi:serine/threonine protein kinase